jgi:hypothetical protein
MPYPAVDPDKIVPGMPLDVSNLETLWKGSNKTNGFLMRNSDGRLPALQLPIGRMYIDAANVLSDDGLVPFGNALWRNNAEIASKSGALHLEKPVKGEFIGVLKYNPGWSAGNPVQPWGVPVYSKGVIIAEGLVGYKTAMAAIGQEAEYLKYLKGDVAQDKTAVRTVYADWVAALQAAAAGTRLALFFDEASGFPLVAAVAPGGAAVQVLTGTPGSTYSQSDFTQVSVSPGSVPVLAGASFAGFALVFEKEHGAVFFKIGS